MGDSPSANRKNCVTWIAWNGWMWSTRPAPVPRARNGPTGRAHTDRGDPTRGAGVALSHELTLQNISNKKNKKIPQKYLAHVIVHV